MHPTIHSKERASQNFQIQVKGASKFGDRYKATTTKQLLKSEDASNNEHEQIQGRRNAVHLQDDKHTVKVGFIHKSFKTKKYTVNYHLSASPKFYYFIKMQQPKRQW